MGIYFFAHLVEIFFWSRNLLHVSFFNLKNDFEVKSSCLQIPSYRIIISANMKMYFAL
jgi:hypothetical protein